MWNIVTKISTGFSLIAFLAATIGWVRVQALRRDEAAIKKADKSQLPEVLDRIEQRFDVPTGDLSREQRYKLVLEQLNHRLRRFQWLLLSGLLAFALLIGLTAFSIFVNSPPALPTSPAPLAPAAQYVPEQDRERALTDQYVRLAGAVEVPILIQLQSTGGSTCGEDMCTIGEPIEPVGSAKFKVQSGGFSKKLGNYWNDHWPFKNALPVGTPLWRAVAADGEMGLRLLSKVSAKLARCVDNKYLRPWDYVPRSKPIVTVCSKDDTKRVGFLFWAFKNDSDAPLRNMQLCFKGLPESSTVDAYLSELNAAAPSICSVTLEIPSLDKGKEAIVLLSIYERGPDGFERRFLSDALIPKTVRYQVGKNDYVHSVRAPLREKAATVLLPFGWYQQ
jgi:hypothetical protein